MRRALVMCLAAVSIVVAASRSNGGEGDRPSDNVPDRHLGYSSYTDPGEHVRLYDDLPESLHDLCALIKTQLIHPFEVEQFAGDIPEDHMYGDEKLPTVSLMLEELLKRDGRGLTASRKPGDRLVVACVHHSMLLASILRHRGIPVRIRAGYATYIGGGKNLRVSHVVCEVWDEERNIWILVDPDRRRIDFPRREFEFAHETWSRLRKGGLGTERYISRYGTADRATVHLLCHDLAYVLGTEEPYWDDPPIVSRIESSISELSADELETLDRLATLLEEPDNHFEELLEMRDDTPFLRYGGVMR